MIRYGSELFELEEYCLLPETSLLGKDVER
jgi:hypothetical protein